MKELSLELQNALHMHIVAMTKARSAFELYALQIEATALLQRIEAEYEAQA